MEGDRREGTNSRAWRDLRDQWGAFLAVLLRPIVIVLSAATALLVWFSSSSLGSLGDNAALQAFLAIVISVLSGVLGAVVEKQWSRISEAGVLVTRGKSAIRGLKLLTLDINAAARRAEAYLREAGEDPCDPKTLSTGLKEMLARCDSLEEEALNAIEEWQEIIPEASPRSEIGVITSLRRDITQLAGEASRLRKQQLDTEQRSDEDRKALQTQLETVTEKLREAERKLRDRELLLDSSVLSGLYGMTPRGLGGTGPFGLRSFDDPSGVGEYSAFGTLTLTTCPKCHTALTLTHGERRCPGCGADLADPQKGKDRAE
jgi:hypothetical protein